MNGRPPFDLSLYLVVGEADVPPGRLEEVVAKGLAGGVTLVQLREKAALPERIVALGRALKGLLDARGVPLIVNDHLEEALAIGAAGVHVGQEDRPAEAARARLGPERLLGLSVSRPEEASDLPPGLVDYFGVGPLYATATKADAKAPIGPQGLAAVAAVTDLPLVAIGGLTAERAAEAIRAGAAGVAVVSAICGADDPESAARVLARAVAEAKGQAERNAGGKG